MIRKNLTNNYYGPDFSRSGMAGSSSKSITVERLTNLASSRSAIGFTDGKGSAETTKRQLKHDMLVTFMANVKAPQQKRRPAPVKLNLMKTFFSFLF
jgi:hypothetical protein